MPYPVTGFLKIFEDMVQILSMLEYFSQRILTVKICSVMMLLALDPACCSEFFSSALGLRLFKMTLPE